MSLCLSSLPLWASVLLIVVLPTLLTVGGTLLTRRSFGFERLSLNNEVAGFKFAVLGVVYAVMLGFAVVVVWERFHDAEAAVGDETAAVTALYRTAAGLPAPAAGDVRQHAIAYMKAVIEEDWPALAQGTLAAEPGEALDAVYTAVLAANATTPRDAVLINAVLTDLRDVTEARRTRLRLGAGIVPGVLWVALFGGAVVTLGFTFFFATPSMRAQALMSGMLAAIIFMALFVAVEIDHPFTGPVSVGPEALQLALENFQAKEVK
ncbi:MAG TPA: DUF4239 domain-containing protein [Acetobacteraceae bacterium]|nr:DUF4239 domain-containing protein [Acetobacteraceae bacterium]